MGKRQLRSSVGVKSSNLLKNGQEKKRQAADYTSSAIKTYKKKTKTDDKVNIFFIDFKITLTPFTQIIEYVL